MTTKLYVFADILNGNVLFRSNPQLCFDGRKTIDWSFILRGEQATAFYYENEKSDRCKYTVFVQIQILSSTVQELKSKMNDYMTFCWVTIPFPSNFGVYNTIAYGPKHTS